MILKPISMLRSGEFTPSFNWVNLWVFADVSADTVADREGTADLSLTTGAYTSDSSGVTPTSDTFVAAFNVTNLALDPEANAYTLLVVHDVSGWGENGDFGRIIDTGDLTAFYRNDSDGIRLAVSSTEDYALTGFTGTPSWPFDHTFALTFSGTVNTGTVKMIRGGAYDLNQSTGLIDNWGVFAGFGGDRSANRALSGTLVAAGLINSSLSDADVLLADTELRQIATT